VFRFGFAEGEEFFAAGVLVGEETLGETAILNFGEDGLHGLLALFVDDARAADVIAPLGGVGDAVTHIGEAAAIDEVDDQLQFMQDFEVGALGLIAGFGEGFIASLYEGADAAAEDGLFTEEVGFGFFFKGGLEDSGAGAADAFEIAKIEGVGGTGRVLVDGDEAGDAAAFGEDFANPMAGSLGAAMPTSMPAAGTMVL